MFLSTKEIGYAWKANPILLDDEDKKDLDEHATAGPKGRPKPVIRTDESDLSSWEETETIGTEILTDGCFTAEGESPNVFEEGAPIQGYTVFEGREDDLEGGCDFEDPCGCPTRTEEGYPQGLSVDGEQEQPEGLRSSRMFWLGLHPSGSQLVESNMFVRKCLKEEEVFLWDKIDETKALDQVKFKDEGNSCISLVRFPPGSIVINDERVDPALSPPPLTPEEKVLQNLAAPKGLLPRQRDVYLATQYLTERRQHQVVWLAIDDKGCSATRSQFTKNSRLESALARVVSQLVAEAARDGIEILVVRLSDNDLPKMLLQTSRGIRAPAHFENVIHLHKLAAGSRVHVIVGGPSEMPDAVMVRLQARR